MKEKLMHLSTYCLNKNIEVLVLTNDVKKEREKNTNKWNNFLPQNIVSDEHPCADENRDFWSVKHLLNFYIFPDNVFVL